MVTYLLFDSNKNSFSQMKDNLCVSFLLVLVILLFSGFIFSRHLSVGSLADWDEANYACIAKTLSEKKDHLAVSKTSCMTTWKYFWFEKPPLFFLIQSQIYRIWGVTTLTSRASGVAFGLGCIVLTFLIGSELFNRKTGFAAALVLSTTPHMIHSSRMMMLDVPVTFFILLTTISFIKSRENEGYLVLAGISCALAVLTKFFIGFLGLSIGVSYIISRGGKTPYSRKTISAAIAAFIIISAPWHILQYSMHGSQFIENYFIEQSIGRLDGFEGHNYGKLFYFMVFDKGFYPWAHVFSFAGLMLILLDRRRTQVAPLMLWFMIVFMFFSFSKSQLPWYIIPVYPAASLVVGRFFTFIEEKFRMSGVLLLIVFLGLAVDLPDSLECNPAYESISRFSGGVPFYLHESLPRTPGRYFYLGERTWSSDSLGEKEKRGGFMLVAGLDSIRANGVFDGFSFIRFGQGIVVAVKEPNEVGKEEVNLFSDIKNPNLSVCYPYMPVNL